MERTEIRDLIVENIGPSVTYSDALRAADAILAALDDEAAGSCSS